jgi:hypothetical protein
MIEGELQLFFSLKKIIFTIHFSQEDLQEVFSLETKPNADSK